MAAPLGWSGASVSMGIGVGCSPVGSRRHCQWVLQLGVLNPYVQHIRHIRKCSRNSAINHLEHFRVDYKRARQPPLNGQSREEEEDYYTWRRSGGAKEKSAYLYLYWGLCCACGDYREDVPHSTNVVMNYSEIESKVREATNDDPWGPSGQLMGEIARSTFMYEQFPEVMNMLWTRMLKDNKKNWRKVYKV
ncbi:EPN4 protein, partial [Polypterus senegalus]